MYPGFFEVGPRGSLFAIGGSHLNGKSPSQWDELDIETDRRREIYVSMTRILSPIL